MDYKDLIFSRYIGQYLQCKALEATHRKSSEEIQFDLSEMSHFSIEEISMRMASFGYMIGFDDNKPVWLLKENRDKQISE